MTVASLVVGICGLVMASLSLDWQVSNYLLTGGRIKVKLLVGGMDNQSMVTSSPKTVQENRWDRLAEQGFHRPIVAVTAANVGRQPVTVERWGLVSGWGTSLYPWGDSIGPNLPHRLEVGQSATWAVDMAMVHAFVETNKTLEKPEAPTIARKSLIELAIAALSRTRSKHDVVAVVELADGRSSRSRDRI